MNAFLRVGYAAAGRLARALAAVMPPGGGKLAQAIHARRGVRGRYAAWGRTARAPDRKLLWMHAPSVGEGLQARPVLQLVHRHRPEIQIAYTHFSPSAAAFASSLDVDFHDVLPFDTKGEVDAALAALRPTALVFSKVDVWPVLSEAAAARGVRLGLISATLASRSSRRSVVAAALLRDAYRRLDAVGAIDAEDAERLTALGVRPEVVEVTGDTRYDQVWMRAVQADRSRPPVAPLQSERPTLVAGSTWPADEGPLLAAWSIVRRRLPAARMIVAPHEPAAAHLAAIERWAAREGLRLRRLGAADAADADVVLVDRLGVLGELYALADLAYVGGGFHRAGLHSVLEPAAFGVPVLFGPRYGGSRDARLLLAAAGGRAVATMSELCDALEEWLTAPAERAASGERALAMVRAGLGADRRSFELVERLLAG